MTVKEFILRKYGLVFVLVTALIGLVSTLSARSQLNASIGLLRNHFGMLVMAERNEFLDEIALHDGNAIVQHLSNLTEKLGADSLTLVFGSEQWAVEKAPPAGSHRLLSQVLSPFLGKHSLTVEIANDFGNFHSTLDIRFDRLLMETVIVPAFLLTLRVTLVTLLFSALVFLVSFRQIQHTLLRPLSEVYQHLRQTKPSKPTFSKSKLQEIKQLQGAVTTFEDLQRQAVVAEVARQVAHDIRSPLFALQVATQDTSALSGESRRLMQDACERIRDIASQLLQKHKVPEGEEIEMAAEPMATLVESVVSEKKLQYGQEISVVTDFRNGSKRLFSRVNPREFKRVLSNLIDNAVEALTERREVKVILDQQAENISISVEDEGKGIPEEVLPNLMKKGATYGKTDGLGLGLFHAREQVQKWGGTISLTSKVGKGTRVQITLQEAKPVV